MREDIAGPQGVSSRPMWETLEGMVREKAQEFIQEIMEEEVTELLGREKSERRSAVDSAEGYRNGYGKPRRLAMSSGTITLRRPRVRGIEERFESRVLPLFARRTKELGALLPELYLHGLAEGDFELAMRGLLGEGAPLSKSSIRRLRAGWTRDFEEWSHRSLEGRDVVNELWVSDRDIRDGPGARSPTWRSSGDAFARRIVGWQISSSLTKRPGPGWPWSRRSASGWETRASAQFESLGPRAFNICLFATLSGSRSPASSPRSGAAATPDDRRAGRRRSSGSTSTEQVYHHGP